ncbi:hypothetical protein QNH03_gp39 [Escherichia phage vB_EcoM_Bp10]|uniref:hypothetical protein n=1 Tax=Escherichia phage vB_EcoM_Bp10 TaxID=2593324 RepID=UPI0024AD36BA|nr:hypothetical protein QNH03_gp39 [Escherichia phage vB_EcoM_Bp10]QEM42571.1 hypothetical protein vBEcoMBp10_39 [Escherichia phage vB_EcoM_Bp10]
MLLKIGAGYGISFAALSPIVRLLLFFRILIERKKHVQKFQYYQRYLPACGWAFIIGDGAILSQLNML